jgi:hypothetical protein
MNTPTGAVRRKITPALVIAACLFLLIASCLLILAPWDNGIEKLESRQWVQLPKSDFDNGYARHPAAYMQPQPRPTEAPSIATNPDAGTDINVQETD